MKHEGQEITEAGFIAASEEIKQLMNVIQAAIDLMHPGEMWCCALALGRMDGEGAKVFHQMPPEDVPLLLAHLADSMTKPGHQRRLDG